MDDDKEYIYKDVNLSMPYKTFEYFERQSEIVA